MKINCLNHLFRATALGAVVFLAVGCSDKKTQTDTSVAVDKTAAEPAALPTTTPNPAPATLAPGAVAPMKVAAEPAGVAADGWAAIKDDTFEQRAHFTSGLQTMAAAMDTRIAAMKGQPATMGAGMMDATMKDITAARTSLQDASDKLDKATADTWTMDKEAVAQAWTRMQTACTKAQGT